MAPPQFSASQRALSSFIRPKTPGGRCPPLPVGRGLHGLRLCFSGPKHFRHKRTTTAQHKRTIAASAASLGFLELWSVANVCDWPRCQVAEFYVALHPFESACHADSNEPTEGGGPHAIATAGNRGLGPSDSEEPRRRGIHQTKSLCGWANRRGGVITWRAKVLIVSNFSNRLLPGGLW
jgi:hypothetical protein